jgi:hypothetical protein
VSMLNLLRALDASRIDYVLVGGLAVSLHGYQRVTLDVDVVLAMSPENLERFVDCAKTNNLHPVAPVPLESLKDVPLLRRWRQEKGMLAFGLREPDAMSTVIDVLIEPSVPYELLRRDAAIRQIGSLQVPVASIDHLIELKTGTGRSKDVIDIEELRKLSGSK